jgi:hypothetical protein
MTNVKKAPAVPDVQGDLEHLRDELVALAEVMQGTAEPEPGTPRKPDSLSDEDAVEAGFDNLPI